MRKPAFCICENTVADQLRGNRAADQRFSFRLHSPSIVFYGCTARRESGLVGSPAENRFSHDAAQTIQHCLEVMRHIT